MAKKFTKLYIIHNFNFYDRDMSLESTKAISRLENSIMDISDVYIGPGVNKEKYLSDLRDDIRNHLCEPFEVSAVIMPPGFSGENIGSMIKGMCVARRDGYWLIYRHEDDRFYCFWGQSLGALGAHGVVGSPIYCWTA